MSALEVFGVAMLAGAFLTFAAGAILAGACAAQDEPQPEPEREAGCYADHERELQWALGEILRVLTLEGQVILDKERAKGIR